MCFLAIAYISSRFAALSSIMHISKSPTLYHIPATTALQHYSDIRWSCTLFETIAKSLGSIE